MTNPAFVQIELNGDDSKKHELFRAIASKLTGKLACEIRLKGTKKQVSIVNEATSATYQFHRDLNDKNVNLQSVIESLNKKHEAAQKFESHFGISWIL
jgi:phosphoribosyl-ATP pyrophosphohydrolase